MRLFSEILRKHARTFAWLPTLLLPFDPIGGMASAQVPSRRLSASQPRWAPWPRRSPNRRDRGVQGESWPGRVYFLRRGVRGLGGRREAAAGAARDLLGRSQIGASELRMGEAVVGLFGDEALQGKDGPRHVARVEC